MLARYFPGKGLCYVDSIDSVKQKLKNVDTFRRRNRAVCIVKCFDKPILTGDYPLSNSTYNVNGGAPLDPASCYIDGGYVKLNCFNNPTLSGGSTTSVPTYVVNGGGPSSVPTCYINGGYAASCYNNPILTGGSTSSLPAYVVNGGTPSSVPSCYIDGSSP
jgi:hypothetical protein